MEQPGLLKFLCLVLNVAVVVALPSTANIGSAPDRTSGNGSIITIELNKQYVPVKRDAKTVMHKAAYFGDVFLGVPHQQKFTVVFDTGSGHFFIPSAACKNETCQKHARYNRNLSESAIDIDHDGRAVLNDVDRDQVNIQYGTGEILGDFSREIVCMRAHSGLALEPAQQSADCVTVRVITATTMTNDPFTEFAFDGVAGLGLESLALHPEFSFFGQMTRLGLIANPRFGVFISRSDHVPSEISFGGHDKRRVQEDIHWSPVASPEKGYWQVAIRHVSIGDVALDVCEDGQCVAIMDTGSSLLGVPAKEAQDINWKLAREVHDEMDALDCRNFPGPDIVFDLGGYNITMTAADYSRPAAVQVMDAQTNALKGMICRASLLPVDLGDTLSASTFIFGEPMLRKYYTAYDWEKRTIGFALAKEPEAGASGSSHQVLGAPADSVLTPSVVMV